MNLRPLQDNVLVRLAARETMTKGGLHIPETAKENERALSGEVLAVGPGRVEAGRLVEPQVKRGDRVLFQRFSIKHETKDEDGVTYAVVREQDLLGVVAE